MFYDRLCWLQVKLSLFSGLGRGRRMCFLATPTFQNSFKVSEWIGDWINWWSIAKSFQSFLRSFKVDAKLLLLLLLLLLLFLLFVVAFVVVFLLFFSFLNSVVVHWFFACKDNVSKFKAWPLTKIVHLQFAYSCRARRWCSERGLRI